LPSGTVTFLFTDIEGSTRLLRALGERYRDALEQLRAILRSAVAARGGVEVDTEGDGCFFAHPASDLFDEIGRPQLTRPGELQPTASGRRTDNRGPSR
jgi:class 3 adenylate cyclase